MLFRQRDLDGIRSGAIMLAFRRWRRPTVRAGGTLLTAAGQLRIGAVDEVSERRISTADARRAGYHTRAELIAELRRRPDGRIYRIELGPLGPDPRVALRAAPAATESERQDLLLRLRRLDRRAPGGAWTRRVLELVRAHPAVRAGDLCGRVGQPLGDFKNNVWKLKGLGLTESLGTGYRISPRGVALLDSLEPRSPG